MPQVTLISYTGHGHEDKMYAAKLLAYVKNTRLEQSAETMSKFFDMGTEELMKELDYIAKTIRSSWEFVDYTFQISGVTRAFTHQLVRTRTASFAQQTQRGLTLRDIRVTLPETVADDARAMDIWVEAEETMTVAYRDLVAMGIPAQDARGILATAVQTNIAMKINLRSLADLLGKRENLRAQGEYGLVAMQLRERVLEVHPWAEGFLSPERTRTPALDAILREKLGTASPVDQPELNAALKELDALKGVWG